MTTALKRYGLGVLAIAVSIVVFIIPLLFMVLTAVKDRKEAAKLDFAWPTNFQFVENFTAVLSARKFMLVTAFINSTILTVVSVTILVILAAMVAWVLQRRKSRWNGVANFLILSGLIIRQQSSPPLFGCCRAWDSSRHSRA